LLLINNFKRYLDWRFHRGSDEVGISRLPQSPRWPPQRRRIRISAGKRGQNATCLFSENSPLRCSCRIFGDFNWTTTG